MAELVLFDGSDLLDEELQKDFVRAFCEANDLDVPEEGSREWEDIVDNDMQEVFYEDLMTEVEEMDRASPVAVRAFVSGSVGRWNGRVQIDSLENRFDYIEDAVNKCIEDIDLFAIKMVLSDDRKSIKLSCGHHDGRNNYEIFLLPDDVIDEIEEDIEEDEDDVSVPPRSEWVTIKSDRF